MERPNHLNVQNKSATSRLTSILIVAGIHVGAIAVLIAALAQGQLIKQLHDIKATVERDKTPPKAPPPPPPDLVKPPPPVAIVPQFQVQTEAPPPITTVAKAPPAAAPPVHAAPPPTELHAITRTHTQPPYPPISQRLGEQGTSHLEVSISTDGDVTDCKVVQTSGSDRLDQAACEWVKARYRWQPPTQNGKAVAVSTALNIIWNLKAAQ